MTFEGATRQKIILQPAIGKPAGAAGGLSPLFTLPKAGYLARLHLLIRGAVSGTLTVPNALGLASVVRKVRLTANNGQDIFNQSGAGYQYITRWLQELENDVHPQNNATAAVTAVSYLADMCIPLAINERDAIGLILLQTEQTAVNLSVEWEADATVATGATVTGTASPYLELFSVPSSPQDQPPIHVVHQILEETGAIAAAGSFAYLWPRGHRYLQVAHGFTIGAAGTDAIAATGVSVELRVNQSDYIRRYDQQFLDYYRNYTALSTRKAGVIMFDLMGSTGLGMYDRTRDTIDSALVTDLASVIQGSGAGTLTTVRRQIAQAQV
jgi:hypothetical protein